MNMHTDNATVTAIKPTARAAVSNGTRLLPHTDGRSVWARRCRDLIELHTRDLGGPDMVSAAEACLIRRASVLMVELETLESAFAQSGKASGPDLDLYSRVSGNLRRLLESLGMERRARPTNGDRLGELLGD